MKTKGGSAWNISEGVDMGDAPPPSSDDKDIIYDFARIDKPKRPSH